MLGLKSLHLFFVFCLFSVSHSSVSLLLTSCGLQDHYLESHFDLFIFLDISLCIVFLVIAFGITIYIHTLLQSTSVDILSFPVQCKLTSLLHSRNIIVLTMSSMCIEHHFTCYNFCFNSQIWYKKLMRRKFIIFIPIFIHFFVLSFLKFQSFLIIFLFGELPLAIL